jgi:hypothetical protein
MPLRDESAEDGQNGVNSRTCGGPRLTKVREQCLRDRPEGVRAVALNRPAGQHLRPPTNALLGDLPQQPRLANPGLARDHQRRALSVRQAI